MKMLDSRSDRWRRRRGTGLREMMSSSDPWVFFGRTVRTMPGPGHQSGGSAGCERHGRDSSFSCCTGRSSATSRSSGVAAEARQRAGIALVHFAEERIFREFPNVFLCVSSINPRARQLYERLDTRWSVSLTTTRARPLGILMRKSAGSAGRVSSGENGV
jgi:hypothetical protein